jgi:signal transduction histidine kinase/phage shock protein PspC (stress-responsive transcriptional regulator)
MLGGVAGGLAAALGIDAWVLRGAFVVLTVAGGMGALIYVVAWLVLPKQDTSRSMVQRLRLDREDTLRIVSVGMIVLGGLLLLRSTTGVWFSDAIVWPVLLSSMGLALIWRQADAEERASLTGLASHFDLRSRRMSLLRMVAGVFLVISGVGVFLATQGAFEAVRQGVLATVGIVTGLVLVFGPWWWRLGKDLADERRGRIRADERAEVGAHLHDSVLQTLALIQRNAGDARSVVSLARRQERELRSWLHGEPMQPLSDSLSAAIEQLSSEVEELHGIAVDEVTVGDCPLDERLQALVGATREALVNAARWSGASTLAVYAEAEADRVSVFVRDRGKGFDPAAVGAGHHGISDSITGRMARHGGTATITSVPGEGTEVELVMKR